ncbi:hypothetical protein [Dapis sp. BLCC M229]
MARIYGLIRGRVADFFGKLHRMQINHPYIHPCICGKMPVLP